MSVERGQLKEWGQTGAGVSRSEQQPIARAVQAIPTSQVTAAWGAGPASTPLVPAGRVPRRAQWRAGFWKRARCGAVGAGVGLCGLDLSVRHAVLRALPCRVRRTGAMSRIGGGRCGWRGRGGGSGRRAPPSASRSPVSPSLLPTPRMSPSTGRAQARQRASRRCIRGPVSIRISVHVPHSHVQVFSIRSSPIQSVQSVPGVMTPMALCDAGDTVAMMP